MCVCRHMHMENTVHRLDQLTPLHVQSSRSQILALFWGTYLPKTARDTLVQSRTVQSPSQKGERRDSPASCFYSRIAHIPDHTSPPPPRVRTRVLLKRISSSSSAWSSSRPVLSCHCLLACILDSLIAIWSRSSFSCRLFSLLDCTRTATGLYHHYQKSFRNSGHIKSNPLLFSRLATFPGCLPLHIRGNLVIQRFI